VTGRALTTRGFAIAASMTVLACSTGDDTPRRGEPMEIREAWARPADSGSTGGAYFSVTNRDTVSHDITGIVTVDAASAELHETMEHEGMTHMMARPSITIARDSTLVMKPGGLHVMLHALTRAVSAGDTIHLSLTLDDGHRVPVAVPVRAP
jgi:periplasmic copper chaperone A